MVLQVSLAPPLCRLPRDFPLCIRSSTRSTASQSMFVSFSYNVGKSSVVFYILSTRRFTMRPQAIEKLRVEDFFSHGGRRLDSESLVVNTILRHRPKLSQNSFNTSQTTGRALFITIASEYVNKVLFNLQRYVIRG